MKKIKDKLFAFLYITWPIWVALLFGAIACFVAYQISISDLPDWLKFWLLK